MALVADDKVGQKQTKRAPEDSKSPFEACTKLLF
jgi:hypothetical protein